MKQELLKELFPNASPSFIRANTDTGNPGPVTELESDTRDGALGQAQIQKRTSEKFLVRVTSFRKRLLDYDNLCEKYHVDCCRYAGIVPADDPTQTEIEVRQVKTLKGEDEFTRVEVFQIQ